MDEEDYTDIEGALRGDEPSKPKRNTIYLGDSVYIDVMNYGFYLYTEYGYGRQNVIFFEPEVAKALYDIMTSKWFKPTKE